MSTTLPGLKRCSEETSALVLTLVTVPGGGKTMHIGESEGTLCGGAGF